MDKTPDILLGEIGASRFPEKQKLLEEAKKLQKEGKDYSHTSWEYAETPDGKLWRSTIDIKEYLLKEPFENKLLSALIDAKKINIMEILTGRKSEALSKRIDGLINSEVSLKEILKENNTLLKAYPELSDLKIKFYYNPDKILTPIREIGLYVDNTLSLNLRHTARMKGEDLTNFYSIFSHEISHKIQEIEQGLSFQVGTNFYFNKFEMGETPLSAIDRLRKEIIEAKPYGLDVQENVQAIKSIQFMLEKKPDFKLNPEGIRQLYKNQFVEKEAWSLQDGKGFGYLKSFFIPNTREYSVKTILNAKEYKEMVENITKRISSTKLEDKNTYLKNLNLAPTDLKQLKKEIGFNEGIKIKP